MSRVTCSVILCLGLVLGIATTAQAQHFRVDTTNIGGDGGTDYLLAEPGTGRVFISRGSHVMVVDGPTGRVIGDIPGTPRVHGIALVPSTHLGFTTNGGDSTVSLFDLVSLAVVRRAPVPQGGLDGIMYDDLSRRIILTNHSRPIGTAVALDPTTGAVVATANLEDNAPEGAASDGKGRLFINNEGTSTMQVLDGSSLAVLASWPLAPCHEPTGIAYDRVNDRIFAGCGDTSVVVNANTGKVVAVIPNGDGVDALGWDPGERLIYIPAGGDGTVTVVHQDSADQYRVIATVRTRPGAKTISVDSISHTAYLFQPEYGPPPASAGGAAPAPGRRGPRGPVIAGWFVAIRH